MSPVAARSGRPLEIVFILASTQNAFFFELAELLGHELRALGVRWRICEEGFPEFASHRVPVLLPPHEYVVLAGHDPGLRDAELLRHTIGICTEQPGTSHFVENHLVIGRLGRAFDISRFAADETRARGLDVEHLQLGHSPLLDIFDPAAERDVDITFIGCRSPRRDRLVADLAPVLTRRRCELVFSDNSRPNRRDARATSFLQGVTKRDLLRRTRILLNIHQSETPYFEWQRAIEAIHAGAVILSDSSAGVAPLVPGRHLFLCRREALAETLSALLDDDERLRRVREAAYGLLRRQLPMRGAAETLVRAARALAARPTHQGRRTAGVPRLLEVPDALLRGPREPLRDPPPVVEGTPTGAAIKRLRLDVAELLRDRVQGDRPVGTRVVARTAAHRMLAVAEISTITALYNHAAEIGEALDSLVPAARPGTEIVVVDDGSTDGSLEVALAWLRAHEHVAAVLVAHGRNRGLPHARNTAVAYARGRLLFVLDADNSVFPDCLERLAAALHADPDAAFAYPLIERHDVLAPSTLQTPFGWDPRRLRRGNYIDAMAMIRADVVRALGGYGTDRRLYGWEDFDLWCRVAERGMRGVLVPAILARYRDSLSSMRSLINVDHTEAWAALFERSPRLFAGLLDDGAAA